MNPECAVTVTDLVALNQSPHLSSAPFICYLLVKQALSSLPNLLHALFLNSPSQLSFHLLPRTALQTFTDHLLTLWRNVNRAIVFDTYFIPGISGIYFQFPSISQFSFQKKETITCTCSLEQHVRHFDDQKELFKHVLKSEVRLLIQSAVTSTQGLEQCILHDQQIPSIAELHSRCSTQKHTLSSHLL